MRYFTTSELFDLHRQIIEQSAGASGVRDPSAVEAAAAQPRMTFDQVDLYPTLVEKAAALCYSLVRNHPFLDGNKRVGHAAMETFLVLNGFEIDASVDDQESVMLELAGGLLTRERLAEWLNERVVERGSSTPPSRR